MSIKMHAKDLPEYGLSIVRPCDPSFDAKLANYLKGESSDVVNLLKPFSLLIENKSKQSVVAYMIQWCFTRSNGATECYRKAFLSERALMEGEYLPEEVEAKSGKIKSNSMLYLEAHARR